MSTDFHFISSLLLKGLCEERKNWELSWEFTWPAALSTERSVWVRLKVFSAYLPRGLLTARERFLSWKAETGNLVLSTCYIVSWLTSFSVRRNLSFIRTLILDGRESRLLSDALLSGREHHLIWWQKHNSAKLNLGSGLLVLSTLGSVSRVWILFGLEFFLASYLVDPASSHMLVSKIKPCMSKYKPH